MKVMVTGHRPNKLGGYGQSDIQTAVRVELYNLLTDIQHDHPDLIAISGMALGVDQWFAQEAMDLFIPVHAYIPFLGQECKWPKLSQDTYNSILRKCTETIVVCEGSYAAWKMQKRNERMVDDANLCIAVWDGTNGGTANCINYIRKSNKELIHINPKELE